jgi:eukaryotic-like serine/threonine-protein kinase
MDATLSDPLVDQLLDGRYAIEARLARGGMASVYLATDIRLERRVAVKVMHAALADDPEFVARFNREARAAARLSHPAVVSVYDQGTDAGHVFLVMEYVAGATLRDVLRDRGKLTPAEAVAVMDYVLAALGAAHAAGLVHRDVKPENVLITPDGRVKVADFGLARAVAGTTLTGDDGMLLGTASYVSPE